MSEFGTRAITYAVLAAANGRDNARDENSITERTWVRVAYIFWVRICITSGMRQRRPTVVPLRGARAAAAPRGKLSIKTKFSSAGNHGATPATDVLQSGDKAGPWIVEHELGRGGMGTVYAVVHEEISKRAALKVLHGRLLGTGLTADRMLLEAKVVNQVGHPNIVDVFDTGHLLDGRRYIVMERLAGKSLSCRANEAKLLPDQVIALLLPMCDALIAAHSAGIVHRDLKLDNVFLCDNPKDPSRPHVKVLDWGVAKVIDHDVRHTIEGQLVGTPQYVSPEQARGGPVSPQTDVYSLGVMAYELFVEELPFDADTPVELLLMHVHATPPSPSSLWPEIPPLLETLLLQMLAKAPDRRPTMLEVAQRLEIVRDTLRERDAPAVPPLTSLLPAGLAQTMPSARRIRSRRWQWATGAAAIMASATLFAVKIGSTAPISGPRPASSVTASSSPRASAATPAPPQRVSSLSLPICPQRKSPTGRKHPANHVRPRRSIQTARSSPAHCL
jgi:serine/threonine protein kinase